MDIISTLYSPLPMVHFLVTSDARPSGRARFDQQIGTNLREGHAAADLDSIIDRCQLTSAAVVDRVINARASIHAKRAYESANDPAGLSGEQSPKEDSRLRSARARARKKLSKSCREPSLPEAAGPRAVCSTDVCPRWFSHVRAYQHVCKRESRVCVYARTAAADLTVSWEKLIARY